MTSPHTILVSGHAGFIGGAFVRQARQRYPEMRIVAIDDFSTGRRDAVTDDAILVEGSIFDQQLVRETFAEYRPETVFHFAARPRISYSVEFPYLTTQSNVLGTVAMVDAAREFGAKRFVNSSSSSVYGTAASLPVAEASNYPHPLSPYAIQKHASEQMCAAYSTLHGLDTVSLRYFTVFGPGQYGDSPYSTVIAAWLESLYFPQNKQGFVEGDGEQSRDFCFIDNVVEANLAAMECDKDFGGVAVNIAHGERTSLNTVHSLIEQLTGRELELERRKARAGDVRHTHADISLARELLGYEASVDFAEGLRRTVDWFENERLAGTHL